MLFRPLLAEAASATLEPRHVVVPLRMMCPRSELVVGSATALDEAARTVAVESHAGTFEVRYERLVLALGSVARTLPVPGLAEHALGFNDLADAIALRNHVLAELEAADLAPGTPHLSFVFVGAGYAGVEALAELHDLVRDALRFYPRLRAAPQRWVLVEASDRILHELSPRLAAYVSKLLARRGIEVRTGTRLERLDAESATLSDGERIETHTLVWTTGVRAHPLLAAWGLPVDERGRVKVDEQLRVEGRDATWAVGDCARVVNGASGLAGPSDQPARPPPGAAARQEPRRQAGPLRLPDDRPGSHARPVQGRGGDLRHPPPRLPRLVRDALVPPLPAAALHPKAPGGHGLDGGDVLPARHRAARHARAPEAPRLTQVPRPGDACLIHRAED